MRIRSIDIFIITSLAVHTAILVKYLPAKSGGIQSGNNLNITFEPVAEYKNNEQSENTVKQHIPAPENNKSYEYNKKTHTNQKAISKFVIAKKSLSSSTEHKQFKNNNLQSKENNGSSRNGHLLRNKINLLLENNFYYPPMARRNNWHGTVEISLRIESDGTISHITLAKSSGYEILDQAAMQNLRNISVIPDAHQWVGSSHYEMTLPIEYRLIDS